MLRVNAINRQELLKRLTFHFKSLVFKTVSVTFTPANDYKMTIVLATAKTGRTVKVNNVETAGGTENTEGSYYVVTSQNITKGTQYVIKQGSGESILMLIILEPIE